ncbi:MAG: hypothetical protein BWX67_02328 [Thermotogae bacterium ADurb.Bin062]|nr:MAG: hypothetical protein BWX67_02328 [Thermotogota bacterium ADurb.Bin062]
MPVTVAVGCLVFEQASLRACVAVQLGVISETMLAQRIVGVCVPAVPENRLNVSASELVRDGRVVVSRVEAHEKGKTAQPAFDFFQYIGDGVAVVDVSPRDMRVDDDIVFAVHRAVLAVMEAVGLALFVQLAAVGVGSALLDDMR